VLIRSNAPVFGANSTVYQPPGTWQVSVTSRNLVSNDHYNGTEEQVQRQALQSYVTNRQNLLDLAVSRVVTNRLSVSVGVPFVNSTWALRDPISPFPGPRIEIPQRGRGIGDISVSSRLWVFNPDTHPDWNVAAGAGLKLPTGNSQFQSKFIDRVTRVEALRYVDQSVQPGDGGWGLMLEATIFKRVNRVFLFGSGSYLANPRDTNDTPSIIATLGLPTETGQFAGLGVNSVPDQYFARLGASVPVWKGFAASLAWRVEGLKRYDLFGASHGWRRPGFEMFWEPGISYSHGPHTFSFNVPIGYHYNRHPNPYTGNPGDATFPRHIFLTSYTMRLGGGSSAPPLTADLTSALGSANEPAVTRTPGAQAPAGWRVRIDRSQSAADPDNTPNLNFVTSGTGMHVESGPAGTFWHPANTAAGNYSASATFNLLKPSGHTNYYGLVFAGANLAGGGQSYTYFLVAQDGTFLVKQRRGEATSDIQAATAHAAVQKPGANGRSTNALEVRVAGNTISYVVNGTVVHTTPKTGALAKTDGIVGIRVNHLLDVQVEGFGVKKE
jgi:hypothetical protein